MMTNDGTFYFSSQRVGQGTNNIYQSKLVNGYYLAAEKLDSTINSAYRDFDPYISPDEHLLIFASARPNGFGAEDLFISFRKTDDTWTPSKNMGEKINSPGSEYCPMLSPDGKFLFFTGARRAPISFPEQPFSYNEFESHQNLLQNAFGDIYWVDTKIIDELRPKDLKKKSIHSILSGENMLEILASVFSFLAVMAKSTRHDNSLDTDMAAIQKLHETDMAAAKINDSLL